MAVQLSNGNQMNPALLATLLGATTAAGAFPTPSSSSSSTIGSSTTGQTGKTDTTNATNEFFQNLMNSLSSNKTSTGQTGFSTPTLSPATQGFLDQLIGQFSALAGKNTDADAKNILNQQVEGINKTSGAQTQLTNEIMASRGLSTSPVAAVAESNNQDSRFSQVNQAKNNLPLLQQQLQLQSLQPAAAFFGQIPTGQVTGSTGDVSSTGVNSQGTSQTGGSNSTATANTTSASQNNTLQGTDVSALAGGGTAGALSGLASVLAALFGGGTSNGGNVTNTGATPTPGVTGSVATPPFVSGGGGSSTSSIIGTLGSILGGLFGGGGSSGVNLGTQTLSNR